MPLQRLAKRGTSARVPQPHAVRAGRGEAAAVSGQGNRPDLALVPEEWLALGRTSAAVPKPNRSIVASGCEAATVGGGRNCYGGACMSTQRLPDRSGSAAVLHPHRAVLSRRCNGIVAIKERYRSHEALVPTQNGAFSVRR